MCQIVCNCQCKYWNRCRNKNGGGVRPITRYSRLCKEYIEDIFGSCMKYNPLLVGTKDLAISIYQLRTGKMDMSRSDSLMEDGDVLKCYELFKELLDFAMSYEDCQS